MSFKLFVESLRTHDTEALKKHEKHFIIFKIYLFLGCCKYFLGRYGATKWQKKNEQKKSEKNLSDNRNIKSFDMSRRRATFVKNVFLFL